MAKTAERQSSLDLTREKLIEAAGEVFAEAGFRDATVREICARAGANVAAVNYHFRDKLGLYTEVIKSTIMAQQPVGQNPIEAHGDDPRAALSALVHQWLERVRDGGKPAWFARIMAHEMTQPTPALDRVTEAMQPNYLRLRTLVGKLIGRSANDARTRMCAHSVVGQILHYVQSRAMLARLWPDLDLDDVKQRRAIADHIVEFSLAGLKAAHRSSALKKRKQAPATTRS
jgi:AcrR family transcriptional regulator